jgi:hypothetical protein
MKAFDDVEWLAGPGQLGSAHSVSSDPVDDEAEARAEQVRKVVEEVTGKPVARAARPRIGFLP